MRPVHSLLTRLGIEHPILLAPMAGVSTPQLAAAVSNAGGLGSLGVGAMGVEQAAQQIHQTRQLTSGPFNVNLFCHPRAKVDPARDAAWLAHLAPHFTKFGAEPPFFLREIYSTALGSDALLEMLRDERPAVVSFHFGLPGTHWIEALHEAGILTFACVTNPDEAEQAERGGIDVLVAQGWEAGGHRGVFDPAKDDRIGTFALVRLLTRQSSLPVVAAGGIMDGAGVAAALRLGAGAVQMGTAFILCPESAASDAYRRDLLSEKARHTAVTSAISGRPARGIVNCLYALEQEDGAPPVPEYPIAYDAGKALHQAASRHGSSDYAAHWAGQGAPLARALPAAEMVRQIVEEWQRAGEA